MNIYRIIASLFFLIIALNTNYAMSHHGPRLPEPMVFDLVLPLGAKKHEYELNTLFQYDFADDAVELNPEIEYVYTDGYAIELELPIVNTAVDAYKVALQGTFDFYHSSKFIHGWQFIAEYHKHSKAFGNDLLYIFGYQFNNNWSMLSMAGLRFTDTRSRGHIEGLINNNLFYTFSKNLTVGIEVDWEARPNRPDILLVMPQVQTVISQNVVVQLGFGMKRSNHKNFPHAGTRVIVNF